MVGACIKESIVPSTYIQEIFIPLEDGVKLATDLYLPADFDSSKRYPILLEYLPYRKDEHRRNRYGLFDYFVKRGYVIARVDIRGTGRSEGKLVAYEYTDQEQEDGEKVISWLASQNWSTGKLAMFGISWGGFNALHLAMRNPPALKTIISLMSTDDLYQDDVHYMDGIMHIDAYEIGQDLANAMPGAPDFIIDSSYFINRFDTEPWLLRYKREQMDGHFWDRASLNTDYSKIKIPVFLIGGLYDGYRDFIPRFFENSDVEKKAILGPWNHTWPNWANPGPAIEWREKAVSWLDYWLKGVNNGITEEAKIAIYQRDYHPPGRSLDFIPGKWQFYTDWPAGEQESLVYHLTSNHRLTTELAPKGVDSIGNKSSDGIDACGSVMWWGDWADDQRGVDSSSLIYQTEPLSNDLEIMGFAKLKLFVSSRKSHSNWYLRLNDVAPDGAITLITGAGFNGSHLDSSREPKALVKDSVYEIEIEMHFSSWTFKKGHAIRISLSNTQWPMFWPVSDLGTTLVHYGTTHVSKLILPLTQRSNARNIVFSLPDVDPEIQSYKALEDETNSGFAEMSEVIRDSSLQITKVIARNSGATIFPWGKSKVTEEIIHWTNDQKSKHTGVSSTYENVIELEERILKWKGILDFTSDEIHFYYNYQRMLFVEDELFRMREWRDTLKRQGQ